MEAAVSCGTWRPGRFAIDGSESPRPRVVTRESRGDGSTSPCNAGSTPNIVWTAISAPSCGTGRAISPANQVTGRMRYPQHSAVDSRKIGLTPDDARDNVIPTGRYAP